nr:MAG TPA: hypothetical protein [Bacteriophage sp.]
MLLFLSWYMTSMSYKKLIIITMVKETQNSIVT